MSEYFFTGGHGAYLRPSYAVFFPALIWDALVPRLQLRRVQRERSLCKRRQASGSTASVNQEVA